jgi:hypothetical protein
MARKPTDFVQFKLRIREALRRKIEKAAEKKDISANAEAVERIEYAFAAEERWEARKKEIKDEEEQMKQREGEIEEMLARQRAANRDSTILNRLIEHRQGSARLLRTVARELGNDPKWDLTGESKKEFADWLHHYIMTNDFAKEDEE